MELQSTGNTLADKELVLQRLQEHLKLKEHQAKALVERKVIIKRDLSEKQARQYCEKFKQLGLDVLIKESLGKKPLAEKEPSAKQEPSARQEPSAKQEPSARQEPSAKQEPSARQEPSAKQEPSATKNL